MSQLAPLDPLLDALAQQDNAWTCLLQLETQVQLTQTSLSLHTAEPSTLSQITDTITDFLWMLLECLLPAPAAPPPSPTLVLHFSTRRLSPPMQGCANIPCLASPDAYNGDYASREHFLQSCVIYIQLCSNNILSNKLKITWVLSYMKFRWGTTYAFGFRNNNRRRMAASCAENEDTSLENAQNALLWVVLSGPSKARSVSTSS
ncbi:hypothetical protein C0992_005493 [Termitomyces sp. T32_za158]|nr:hypothetical protein C0992_005493 [Termitomyces sp. T32_za158]